MAFAPDGKTLATAGDERVFLWDVKSGKKLKQVTHIPGDVPLSIAFTPDGKRLLCAAFEGQVQLEDLASGKPVWTKRRETFFHDLALSPDGKKYAFGSGGPHNTDDILEVGSISGNNTRVFQDRVPLEGVSSVAFSPDGKAVFVGGWAKIIARDAVSLKQLKAPLAAAETSDMGIYKVVFSPDGKLLASTGNNNTILLWNVASGKVERVLKGHRAGVDVLVFSRDGKTLASACWHTYYYKDRSSKPINDDMLKLWDVQTGKERNSIRVKNIGPTAIAFSPDDKILAVGDWKGTITFWKSGLGQNSRN